MHDIPTIIGIAYALEPTNISLRSDLSPPPSPTPHWLRQWSTADSFLTLHNIMRLAFTVQLAEPDLGHDRGPRRT